MNKDKAINTVRLAFGTASYCKSCRALATYGVNSAEAMRAIGVPSQAWVGWLKRHEAYHTAKGEELPDEWTERGLTQEFKDAVLTPKPKYVPAPMRDVTDEEKAIVAFKLAARPVIHQRNGRRDNKPILAPLDTTPFKGL